jgi:hypothetical protein
LDRWRKHFYQLYIVHGVNGVRQTDIHKYIQTAEPPVPEPSAFENEMDTGKLKDTNHQVLIKSQQR